MINNEYLITCALPYSNGPIHIGHLLEHIQADIWAKYKKMDKNIVYLICSDDCHGTPIMFKANKLNINPIQMVLNIHKEHIEDLSKFSINYDSYSLTHSSENKKLTSYIFNILNNNGFIKERIITQLYDYNKSIFLPDRFIIGTCPYCFSDKQYGDFCEKCGSTYNSIELLNPKSLISNSKLIKKKTNHLFFNLPIFKDKILFWIKNIKLQKPILNKILDWLKLDLKEWNISRDFPYFGFKIPNFNNKYFYVWFDAHIGYISSFKELCKNNNKVIFEEFWNINSDKKIIQFIGKDIIYFHTLLWPSILDGINFRKPNNIIVHGHLTVNNKKMSKSNENFISAKKYIENLDSDFLRYYFSSKLSPNIDDINFNTLEFVNKINSNIINKIINLASRNIKLIDSYFNCKVSNSINNNIYNYFINESKNIWNYYDTFEYSKIIDLTIKLSDIANKYISQEKPWNLIKNKKKQKKLHQICSTGINLFKVIMTYLKPIMPKLSIYSENLLNIKLSKFNLNIYTNSFYEVKKFYIKYKKIKISQVEKLLN